MSQSGNLRRRTFLVGTGAVAAGALAGQPVSAQGTAETPDGDDLETFLDRLVESQLEKHDIAGATVSVVDGDDLSLAKGYGYADVEEETPVIGDETLFRVGSLTKLFGWTGVMQGVERGDLELDTDVNAYLDEVTIPATYSEPITLDHLGTHTAGFEERYRGTVVEEPEDLRPLGKVLAEERPARVRPPGELASYSNYGAALASHIIAKRAGTTVEEYVQEHILDPLEMDRTTLAQPVPDSLARSLSKGYHYTDGSFREGEIEYVGVPPAGSMCSTAADMARFMRAHLNGGEVDGARILEPATVEEMHRRRFAHDERVNGICYGFYEFGRSDDRAVGHTGGSELFHSLLVLLPEHDLGLFVSFNSPGGERAIQEVLEAFLDQYLGEPDPPDAPTQQPTRAEELSGAYRPIRTPYTTYEKIGAFGQGFDVRVEDNVLITNIPWFGVERWVEVDPLVFRRTDGKETLVFREHQGEITHLIHGRLPVITFERLGWYETPATQLAVIGFSLVLFLSAAVGWTAAEAWRIFKGRQPGMKRFRLARLTAGVASTMFLGFVAGLGWLVLSDPIQLAIGTPTVLLALLVLPVLGCLTTLGALGFCVFAWREGYWGLLSRLHYTLVVLASFVFLAVLAYWNLLGFNL